MTFEREMEIRGVLGDLGFSITDTDTEVQRERSLEDLPKCCECDQPTSLTCPICEQPLCAGEPEHVEGCAIAKHEMARIYRGGKL